jgi:DNA-binding PucR family transcriptional regulator
MSNSTRRAYLDNQGSTTRAAAALHLHRNATASQAQRIFERLGVDPQDPDAILMLQLACRARPRLTSLALSAFPSPV